MMKRIETLLLVCLLLLGATACGSQQKSTSGGSAPETSNTESQTPASGEPTNSGTEAEDDTLPSEVGEFDLQAGTVLLNSGYEMPVIGLGTFRLSDSECENSVYHALLCGGRLIDTARIYGNEAAVGRAIQRAIDEGIVTREEIFETTAVEEINSFSAAFLKLPQSATQENVTN